MGVSAESWSSREWPATVEGDHSGNGEKMTTAHAHEHTHDGRTHVHEHVEHAHDHVEHSHPHDHGDEAHTHDHAHDPAAEHAHDHH